MIRPTLVAGWCDRSLVECPACSHVQQPPERITQWFGVIAICRCGATLQLRSVAPDRWLWAVVEEVAA